MRRRGEKSYLRVGHAPAWGLQPWHSGYFGPRIMSAVTADLRSYVKGGGSVVAACLSEQYSDKKMPIAGVQ